MVNKVVLIGRVGKDPEVRRLESGNTVAKFSIATDESYKDKEGNKVEQTEWHNIVVWRQLAEIAEKFFKKGMLIYVEGKLTHREYTDKDNQKRYITEVVASVLKMLDGKKQDAGGNQPTGQDDSSGADNPASDDLPF